MAEMGAGCGGEQSTSTRSGGSELPSTSATTASKYRVGLTMARQTRTANPSKEKYATNVGREKRMRRSSSECVGSGTIPKMAIRTAPPAMRRVPRTIQREKTSPRMKRAKRAFHSSETAPRGARMTTGREAIWNSDPKILEDMKITANEQIRRRRWERGRGNTHRILVTII